MNWWYQDPDYLTKGIYNVFRDCSENNCWEPLNLCEKILICRAREARAQKIAEEAQKIASKAEEELKSDPNRVKEFFVAWLNDVDVGLKFYDYVHFTVFHLWKNRESAQDREETFRQKVRGELRDLQDNFDENKTISESLNKIHLEAVELLLNEKYCLEKHSGIRAYLKQAAAGWDGVFAEACRNQGRGRNSNQGRGSNSNQGRGGNPNQEQDDNSDTDISATDYQKKVEARRGSSEKGTPFDLWGKLMKSKKSDAGDCEESRS